MESDNEVDSTLLFEQINDLHERFFGVSLKYEEFLKPDGHTFVNLLVALLKMLECDIENVIHPQLQLSVLNSSNIDIYANAIYYINIYLLIKYVFGMVDEEFVFSLYDMYRPKQSKLNYIYNLIVQISNAKAHGNSIYAETFDQISSYKNQILDLQKKVCDLKSSLPHKKNEILMKEDALERHLEKYAHLKSVLDKKINEKETIENEVSENENKQNCIKKHLETIKAKIEANLENMKKLKELIVPDPESFQTEFNEIKHKLDASVDDLLVREREIDMERSELLKYVELKDELKILNFSIAKIEDMDSKIKEATKTKKSTGESLKNAEESYVYQTRCKEKMIENIVHKKKYLAELDRTLRKKHENEERELQESSQLETNLTSKLKELELTKLKLQEDIDYMKLQIETENSQYHKKEKNIYQNFEKLKEKVENFTKMKEKSEFYKTIKSKSSSDVYIQK